MGRVVAALGLAASSLSLVMLVQQGYQFGLEAPLRLLVDYYARAVGVALGGLEPPLSAALLAVGSWLSLDLHLYPHWKLVLVPMWLYVAADARITWGMGGSERKAAALAILLYGGVLALASSVVAGSIALGDSSLLMPLAPMTGLVLYSIVQAAWDSTFNRYGDATWWDNFSYYARRIVLTNALIGAVVVGAGFALRSLRSEAVNISLLLLFIALLAVRHLVVSAVVVAVDANDEAEAWSVRFKKLAGTRLGIMVLNTMAGAAVFLLMNAGMSLAGL